VAEQNDDVFRRPMLTAEVDDFEGYFRAYGSACIRKRRGNGVATGNLVGIAAQVEAAIPGRADSVGFFGVLHPRSELLRYAVNRERRRERSGSAPLDPDVELLTGQKPSAVGGNDSNVGRSCSGKAADQQHH